MYSYEDRIRAVELYIKLGLRVRPTIGQLGYSLVQRKADQDIPWLTQPYRISGDPWTYGIKTVQVLIRIPTGSFLRGNQHLFIPKARKCIYGEPMDAHQALADPHSRTIDANTQRPNGCIGCE